MLLTRIRWETCEDMWGHQGWHLTPRDVMRIDFQEITFLNVQDSDKIWATRTVCKLIQNIGGTRLDSMLRMIWIWIGMFHLDTIWEWESWCPIGSPLMCEDHLISETCHLEESASHHEWDWEKFSGSRCLCMSGAKVDLSMGINGAKHSPWCWEFAGWEIATYGENMANTGL